MNEYVYNPDYAEDQDNLSPEEKSVDYYDPDHYIDEKYGEDGEEEGSTLIKDLDEIEQINRHSDEFAKIKTDDNPYPDILKKPLYTAVVPDGGILTTRHTTNERTSRMTNRANSKEKGNQQMKTLSNMSLKEFSSKISNSLLEILNDLLTFDYSEFENEEFLEIFTKEERLIAIGILLIIVSVFFLFFK